MGNPFHLSEVRPKLVRNRYEILESQHQRLEELSQKFSIPTSALVRLAINCFLPKLTNYGYTEEGIQRL